MRMRIQVILGCKLKLLYTELLTTEPLTASYSTEPYSHHPPTLTIIHINLHNQTMHWCTAYVYDQ